MTTMTNVSPPPKPYSAAIFRPLPITLLACLVTAAGLGCKQEASSTSVQPKPEVEVMEVVQKDVPIYTEWIGTTNGMENAKIRAQVKGFLFSRHYREGAFVKKGSLLFEIDPQKFQADLDKAKGDLARAQAQLGKTELDVQRDTPLVKGGAVSQKELDDDIQANLAARASVVGAKAVVATLWATGVAASPLGKALGMETDRAGRVFVQPDLGTALVYAGYIGGAVESVIMRCMDVMLAIPGLLFAIGIVALLGPGLTQTYETPDLLAEAGVKYIGDWVWDDEPAEISTIHCPPSTAPPTASAGTRRTRAAATTSRTT